jgi:hypothetical protein
LRWTAQSGRGRGRWRRAAEAGVVHFTPPPPPAYQLRARPAWVREGGCDGLGLGMASVCI